jgi:hypothetical protein
LGSMLRCLTKMGSVQRATAPKPTIKTLFGNVNIVFYVIPLWQPNPNRGWQLGRTGAALT